MRLKPFARKVSRLVLRRFLRAFGQRSLCTGSYKRVSASATLPNHTSAQIQSQLVQRVIQEATLLRERVQSQSSELANGDPRPCPVTSLASETEGPLQLARSLLETSSQDGQRIIAVLDFDSSEALASASLASQVEEIAISRSMSCPLVYELETLLHRQVVFGDAELATEIATSQVRSQLDALISTFARRKQEIQGTEQGAASSARRSSSPPLLSTPRSLYALRVSAHSDDRTLAEYVRPLLVALERLKLWHGVSWSALE